MMKTIFKHIKDNAVRFAVFFAVALTGCFVADFITGKILISQNMGVAVGVAEGVAVGTFTGRKRCNTPDFGNADTGKHQSKINCPSGQRCCSMGKIEYLQHLLQHLLQHPKPLYIKDIPLGCCSVALIIIKNK